VILQGIITKIIGKPTIIVSTYPPVEITARTKTTVWELPGPRNQMMILLAAIPSPYHDVWCIIVREHQE